MELGITSFELINERKEYCGEVVACKTIVEGKVYEVVAGGTDEIQHIVLFTNGDMWAGFYRDGSRMFNAASEAIKVGES